LLYFRSPVAGGAVLAEVEIDTLPANPAAQIFAARPSVAGDVESGSGRKHLWIDSDHSGTGHAGAGGLPDNFDLPVL
jgi:hypothetical protein